MYSCFVGVSGAMSGHPQSADAFIHEKRGGEVERKKEEGKGAEARWRGRGKKAKGRRRGGEEEGRGKRGGGEERGEEKEFPVLL